jgi:hypothetical protein
VSHTTSHTSISAVVPASTTETKPRRRASIFRQWRNRAYNAQQDFLDYFWVGISILKRKLGIKEKTRPIEELWRDLGI